MAKDYGVKHNLEKRVLAKQPEEVIERVAENKSGEFTKSEQRAAQEVNEQK